MFTVVVSGAAEEILQECQRRGLVITLDTVVRTPPGGRHWHLGFEGMRGVLEVTDAGGVVSLKVAANRDGGWATSFAKDLASRSYR
jgi:hypothetical protein